MNPTRGSRIRILEMVDRPFLGGGQRNLLDLASRLDRERFEVAVCSSGGGPLVESIRGLGLHHFPVPFEKKRLVSSVRKIGSLLDGEGFDLLHTHGGVAGLFGRLAARRRRFRAVVHTLHGIHYLNYRSGFLRRLYARQERWLGGSTSAVIAVCRSDLRKIEAHRLAPAERVTVIPNGIDFPAVSRLALTPEENRGMRRELGISEGATILGTVARLHRQKGIPELLIAFALVRRSVPESRLILVGDGPERAAVAARRSALGLDKSVLLLGEREDAGRLLSLFDVFVLSSRWEGLPYVLLEAAALAKPTAATDVDGVSEIITDGESGFLSPARDPEALARSVLTLMRDPNRAVAMGRALKASASRSYGLDDMIARTAELYLRLAPRKG